MLTLTAAGCADKGSSSSSDKNSSESGQVNSSQDNVGDVHEVTGEVQPVVSDKVKDKDLDDSYSDPTAKITFGDSVQTEGSGVTESGGVVTVTQEGTYIFSGKSDNAQIVIAADEKADVKIVLDGADIKSTSGSAIYAQTADKVIVTLAPESSNRLTDGANSEACIYAECDLTINGGGSLSITGGINDGIVTKDDLALVDGDISVNAVSTGIKGKDSVTLYGGKYSVTCGGDGLKSTTADDSEKGWVVVSGGEIAIESGSDGIQAETSLTFSGGKADIKTDSALSDTGETAGKGLKAVTGMNISGGEIAVSSVEHCLHCDGALTVDGGKISADAQQGDGISADGDVVINGGDITVTRGDEGIESKAALTINGGNIDITASDDGMNTGGSDMATDVSHDVSISGGNVRINAEGDGIDSNGDINISGGAVTVFGPTGSGDGPLDCGDMGGKIVISGGTVMAAGSVGMMQLPDETASQNSIYTTMLNAAQGDTITLADDEGNVIVTFTAEKQLAGMTISSPDIKSGTTYHLYKGGKIESGENGEAFTIDTEGAQEIASGEAAQVNTSFGGSVQGGFGGGKFGGGFGGGQRPDDGQMPGGRSDGGRGGMGDMNGTPPEMPDGESPVV